MIITNEFISFYINKYRYNFMRKLGKDLDITKW